MPLLKLETTVPLPDEKEIPCWLRSQRLSLAPSENRNNM
jgi:hypothetical protein